MIGGAGAMGHVVVRDLLDNPQIEVVIADYDRDKADALADTLNSKLKTTRVRGDFTDITNKPVMVKGLKNAACVINSTPYYHNVNVMEAALEAGCHYVDLGGLFHVSKEQLKLHDRFVEKGLTAVIGMGAAPGMTNIMAAKAQENMESVESIDIYVGSIDNTKSSHPFLPPYSIETLIDEYTMPPMVFDGEHAAPCDVRAFNPALQAVCLALLADDERIELTATLGGHVHHRCSHRVCTERQAADSFVVKVRCGIKQCGTDEGRGLRIKRHPPQVDVVVSLATAGQNYLAEHDGFVQDLLAKGIFGGLNGFRHAARVVRVVRTV